MCSTSKLGGLAPLSASSSGQSIAAEAVSAAAAKANPDKYILIDIREPFEQELAPAGAAKVTMGKLVNFAFDGKVAEFDWFSQEKTMLLLCPGGMRAAVAATELVRCGYRAAYVPRGLLEWDSPAATKPGFVVVLSTKDTEKVSLALAAAKTSQSQGTQTVLVCMSSGVEVFRKVGVQGCSEADVVTGIKMEDPFPPAAAAWAAFKQAGGVTLLCTTCVKARKLEGPDFQDGAVLFNMPDLLRMQQECSANLQFS